MFDHIPPAEIERLLRQMFEESMPAGDLDGAVEVGANLTSHLTRSGSAQAAREVPAGRRPLARVAHPERGHRRIRRCGRGQTD